MKTTLVEKRYHTEISKKQMLAILEADERIEIASGRPSLMQRLMDIGCTKVEYDGHFGPFIWYTLAVDDDTPEVLKRAQQVIRDAINGKAEEEEES